MKIFTSNVCRIKGKELEAVLTFLDKEDLSKKTIELPEDILAPRQAKMPCGVEFTCRLSHHRGQYIPTVTRATVENQRRNGAEYCQQSALVLTMEEYLVDPDVSQNKKEHSAALSSDAHWVLVATVGGARDTIAVCRNIVSGCQNQDNLQNDAMMALRSTNVFLIEED